MKKTILEVYALAVCFFTVACFAVALGFFIYDVIGIANPEFTLPHWEYTRHQTNDEFWGPSEFTPPRFIPGMEPAGQERVRPDAAELTTQRLASYARVVANERRENTQTVVKSAIVIFIDMLVFFIHWIIVRREVPGNTQPGDPSDTEARRS